MSKSANPKRNSLTPSDRWLVLVGKRVKYSYLGPAWAVSHPFEVLLIKSHGEGKLHVFETHSCTEDEIESWQSRKFTISGPEPAKGLFH